MQDHFDSWQHSSHRHVAVCNDCDLPHHSIGKWVVKADNGFFHSLAWDAVMEGFRLASQMDYATAHAELVKTPDGTPNDNQPLFPGGLQAPKVAHHSQRSRASFIGYLDGPGADGTCTSERRA